MNNINKRNEAFNNKIQPYNPWNPHEEPGKQKPISATPRPVTIADLFPQLDRWAIGYADILATLKETEMSKGAAYPPYNVTKFKDGKWEIQMAVAGFRKEELEITIKDRTLTISSEVVSNDNPKYGQVIHQGIAQRNFTTKFALADYVEVESATLEDGMLSVKLVTNLPEEKKPKVIDIQ